MQEFPYSRTMADPIRVFLDNALIMNVTTDVATMSALFVLYSIHRQYDSIREEGGRIVFDIPSDSILKELYSYVEQSPSVHRFLLRLHAELSAIPYSEFESSYADGLDYIFDRDASSTGKPSGDSYTAREITEFLSYLVNREGYSSVFDPFCGSASMARMLRPQGELRYCGQELHSRTALLARINLNIAMGSGHGISVVDSIREWNRDRFDAVVTCPPLGMKTPRNLLSSVSQGLPRQCGFLSDLIVTRAFSINGAKMVALMESTGFCFKGGIYKDFRQHLVESNLLDTVIALPAGLLYGTSISSVIVICRAGREKDAPVTFIDASTLYTGRRNKVKLDLDRLKNVMESGDPCYCMQASAEMIAGNDFSLIPSLYTSAVVSLGAGQTVVRLSSLLSPVRCLHQPDGGSYDPISSHLFRNELVDVLLNRDAPGEAKDGVSSIRKYYHVNNGETYLLVDEALKISRFALRSGARDFSCNSGCFVYRINEELVTPEYLVNLLTGDELIRTGRLLLSSGLPRHFVIDSIAVQKAKVGDILRAYDQHMQESVEADARRLGIKRNISDLEHMLGSTQLRIDDIIATLEEIRPDDETYRKTVKSLKDNVEYMNRMIKFSNASISDDTFNMKDQDLSEFIGGYADAWRNYGGGYFTLDVVDSLPEGTRLSFDKVMMTVMLDSILSNAVRHSFHKRKNYTKDNRVEINLSEVEYESRPYVRIQVSNNGDPISEGFTLKDYISRGRRSEATGRSGLGGYHVYRIAKGHEGYLYLDSSRIWNFIVEVLLPLPGEADENMEDYVNECI